MFPSAVINVMVDPDGTLDALTSLGLTSPTTPTKLNTNPGPQAPIEGSAKGHSPSVPPVETDRDLGGGFSRVHPNGEENAITQK